MKGIEISFVIRIKCVSLSYAESICRLTSKITADKIEHDDV